MSTAPLDVASPFLRVETRGQKPPVRLYVPPVIGLDASGCPIVPPSEYPPPVEKVAPPPATTLDVIVYPPPLWARASRVRAALTTSSADTATTEAIRLGMRTS